MNKIALRPPKKKQSPVVVDKEADAGKAAEEAVAIVVERANTVLDLDSIVVAGRAGREKITAKPTGRRAKIPVRQITERMIEEAVVDKESEDVKKVKVKSSIRDDIEFSYAPLINWGSFDVKGLVDKMMLFAEKMSGLPLHPYQKEFQRRVFESALMNDGEEITALFARQSGKTEAMAATANALLVLMPVLAEVFPKQLGQYKRGFRIGLFAPTGEQAFTTHQRMDMRLSSESADELLTDDEIDAKKSYSGGLLQIIGPMMAFPSGKVAPAYRSYCKVQSAAKQTKIESKTYDLIIVEEAQDVDTLKVQKSIHPMLASTNGTIVKIGTATSFISDFYRAIQQNRRRTASSKIRNHFEYDYRVVQKFNPAYKAFIRKEKERLGEHSDAFRMAYCLEWLIEKGMALTPQMFEEYMKDVSLKYEYVGNGHSIYAAGLDLAKKEDSTVLTIMRLTLDTLATEDDRDSGKEPYVKEIVNWLEMTGDNWETQFHTVLSFVMTYQVRVLAVDTTGPGDPIAERLAIALEDTDCTIVEVPFSTRSKHEMAVLFYDELRKRRIRVPAHATVRKTKRYSRFLEQFYSCEKTYRGNFMQLEHTDQKGAQDDYVDSLLLACYGVEKQVMPKITQGDNPFFRGGRGKKVSHSKRFDQAMNQLNRKYSAKWRKRSA